MRGQAGRSVAEEKVVPGEGCADEATPGQAWRIRCENPHAALFDVRPRPEWVFVGVPDLSGRNRRAVFMPWRLFPNLRPNPGFANQLEAAGVKREGLLGWDKKRRRSTGGWKVAGLPLIRD